MSVVELRPRHACKWCGKEHHDYCPLIEAIEYDPDTQNITRIEFRDMTEDECESST